MWWTLAIAAVPGFAATIVVHLTVGYHDLRHLAPVFVGAGLIGAGLGLACPFLMGRDPRTDEAWSLLREGEGVRTAP